MTTGHDLSPYGAVDSGGVGYGSYSKKDWAGGDWVSSEGVRLEHQYQVIGVKNWDPLVQWGYTFVGTTPVQRSAGIFSSPTFNQPSGNLQAATMNRLYAKVAGTDFNATVMGAELGKTIEMLVDTIQKVDKAYRMARRGNFRGASRVLLGNPVRRGGLSNSVGGALANNWLELQYGWLQAARDIQGMFEVVDVAMRAPVLKPVTVSVKVEKAKGDQTWTTHKWKTSHSKYVYEMRYQPIATLDAATLLGLRNPLSAIHERISHSFLLDWLIPVGPYIQALGASRALTGVCSATTFWKWECSGLQTGLFYKIKGGEAVRRSYYQVARTTGLAQPPKLFTFNPLENIMGPVRMANAVALIAQDRR